MGHAGVLEPMSQQGNQLRIEKPKRNEVEVILVHVAFERIQAPSPQLLEIDSVEILPKLRWTINRLGPEEIKRLRSLPKENS